ncbi:MAG: hypothetical protein KDE01_34900, partial [Caldilineaceae bacterium]|nr:hypothetical protein [Caldilineaceae bacterium]
MLRIHHKFVLFVLFMLVALSLSACQPVTREPQVQSAPASAPEVFVEGAPVRLAVGLAIGPDDNLYVSTQWIR